MAEPLVYLVPSLDVCWANFGPMRPHRNFIADPPPEAQCAEELAQVVARLGAFLEGQYVLAVHTGAYNRDAFYRPPFLEQYRLAAAQGAEVAIHPHEELRGKGTGHITPDYMREMVRLRMAELAAAGVTATAYKGGHFSYPAWMTAILDEAGLHADLSGAPGYSEPLCHANWIGAPDDGGYLSLEDPTWPEGRGTRSRVFEIPLGNDGTGADDINTLYNEKSDLANLVRVYEAIRARGAARGRPQFVHYLFHNTSIAEPRWLEQFQRLIEHARTHQGVVASPLAAKAAYDRLALAPA
ncbi:hypothetical protein [Roseomonas sp. AR75]|uniref:hypothetical protein n=1 Tax=Roseomonas sp. AR75 TaxID=2562311 RepID=UPI0010C02147|nr:hypothetical protein [Roseomonas sp. AR75]